MYDWAQTVWVDALGASLVPGYLHTHGNRDTFKAKMCFRGWMIHGELVTFGPFY